MIIATAKPTVNGVKVQLADVPLLVSLLLAPSKPSTPPVRRLRTHVEKNAIAGA